MELKKTVKKSKSLPVKLIGLSKNKNTSIRVRTYNKPDKKTTCSSYVTVGKRTPTTKIMDIQSRFPLVYSIWELNT